MDIAFIVFAGWIHGRTGDSLYTASVFIFITIVGLIFLIVLPTVAKLAGLYLVYSYVAAYILFLSSVAANTSGYTKKLLTNAVVLIGYTVGNIIGPLIMTSNQAPLYIGGVVGCICANGVAMAIFLGVRLWMSRMNKKKAANPVRKAEDGEDLTDLEDPNFVYRL
jgi:ACS family allantoate permease-like MFS transporter